MKQYTHYVVQNTARIMPILCGVLFVLFTVCFLFLFQSPYLASYQYILSDGTTVFHPVIATTLLTLVLLIPPVVLYRFVDFPLRLVCLPWFPSCWLLALLCCGHFSCFASDTGGHYVVLGFILSAIIWIVLMYISIARPDSKTENETFSTYAVYNLGLMLLMFLFVGFQSNSVQSLHQEMHASVLLAQRQDSTSLLLGKHQKQPTRTLTAIRSLSLSRLGELNERLFDFPQHYGVDGLFPEYVDTLRVGNPLLQVYQHLHVRPANADLSTLRFLELSAHKDTVPTPRVEYYLMALLLQRDIERLSRELPRYYTINDSLPCYYRQAYVLFAYRHSLPNLTDDFPQDEACLQDFLLALNDNRDRAHHLFGDTYWWYYFDKKCSWVNVFP